jgi:WD40 repeat protein
VLGHEGEVRSAAFSPDGKWVVTASLDNTARVWEAATGRELAVLRGHEGRVTSAAFSPDGRYIVTASADGTAHIYLTRIEDLMELARSRVTRELTPEERRRYLHED